MEIEKNDFEYKTLPVYEQKNRILDALRENQVVVVQSPTGSGKTTQIPIILHEAGYDQTGMIAVTQPRRIAALSVSEFISKQLGTTYPGLVGYKMRFEDKTDLTTKIKIMTDGILLQEMKLDPWLSKYSVMMVDEAHERSLNIDFVLGLLKRVLKERREFKVIVSSATMNAEAFQDYFGGCPIVTIDTVTYPITMVYDSPKNPTTTLTDAGCDELLGKICDTVQRILDNDRDASGNGNVNGGILIFLPGEKIIKDCMRLLDKSHFASRIHTLPLYGRLSKEDQERVFLKAPHGKKKIIISTNIAETSVTIPDITAVIDSGLAKLNFYNPHTFTSSLIETQVSRASCNQRRGRAGRTAPGTCYRLYSKKDFDTRSMYTTEEIYRTDLSEVVLQMADLGITNFKGFDFISSPGADGIDSAVETLNMLGALNEDNTLSSIGKMMVRFPLEPRVSRIIVESIMHYPSVLKEALVASSFLSANSPYILPPGEEMEARKAHHSFRDIHGDFVSFLNMFDAFEKCTTPDAKAKFCKRYYLDERILLEIENIDKQLSEIVSEMNIPISSGGDKADYLSCIASGMIQFVCVRTGKNKYKSLTQDHICIHPGSVMFRQDPLYIVAGEIVRTSRMFAMSVSPLTKRILEKLSAGFVNRLDNARPQKSFENEIEIFDKNLEKSRRRGESHRDEEKKIFDDDSVIIGGKRFALRKIKGESVAILPIKEFLIAVRLEKNELTPKSFGNIKAKIVYENGYSLMGGERLYTAVMAAKNIGLYPRDEVNNPWNKKCNVNLQDENAAALLTEAIELILQIVVAKQKSREYGFICLFTDGKDNYWVSISRGIATAVNESLASLESLVDKDEFFTPEQQQKINEAYRMLNEMV